MYVWAGGASMDHQYIPILVGCGQVTQRVPDPAKALNALDLTAAAAREAAEDAQGGKALLEALDTIVVLRSFSAAKAGLNAMTEAFADAYGPAVRVNAILPGPFLTDISKAWDMDEFRRRAAASIALKRGGQAEEIVAAALYLASDHASYTTGALLRIDGGSH